MAKRAIKPPAKERKRPRDINQLAHQLVRESTADQPKAGVVTPLEVSRVMAALGRKGGRIGGQRRAARMTDEERSNAAALAARARWSKVSKQQ